MAKEIAHSHSSLGVFETCPHWFYRVRVLKDVKEPPNESNQWGLVVHKALELRVARKTPLPEGMEHWEPIAAQVEATPGKISCEMQIAVDRQLRQVPWFDHTVWFRAVLDVDVDQGSRAVVVDWKTGKVKEDNTQLRLFGAVKMTVAPYVERVDTLFVWLKDGKGTRASVVREEVPLIWAGIRDRARRVEESYQSNVWPCKPSGLCRGWCPVRDCQHWQQKR